MSKAFFKDILTVILLTLISMYYAFYNQYPLVTEDSGFYITYGFEGLSAGLPPFRPITYGLLVRHLSLSQSLWFVIFFQSLIISYLLFDLIKYFIPGNSRKASIFIGIILSLFSTYSFFVSQIMADIFTAASLLCILLILLNKNLSKIKLITYIIIFFITCITHISNSLIIFVTLILIIFVININKKFRLLISNKQIIIAFTINFISFFTIPLFNFFAFNEFVTTKQSHLFIMGKLVEDGILKEYLNDKCSDSNFKLCVFKDQLPTSAVGFIFAKDGIPSKTDGLMDETGEYKRIIKGTLTEGKYLKLHFYKSIFHTFSLLCSIDAGNDNYAMGNDNYPSYGIRQARLPEYNEYVNSKQNLRLFDFDTMNLCNKVALFLSMIFLIAIFNKSDLVEQKVELIFLAFFTAAFLFSNAFICASMSGNAPRYNAKAIWMINLVVCIFTYIYYIKGVQSINQRSN